jgi:adenylate cyclase
MTRDGDDGGPRAVASDDAYWRDFLANPDSLMQVGRRFFSRLPANPRCRLCAAPFAGYGGPIMRVIGKGQSSVNPTLCRTCERQLMKKRGGAEVQGTTLFADIRGSTTLAERMTATEFRSTLDRFYTVASDVVFTNGGMIDKFVGDEVVAAFPPYLGADHAGRAVAAAQELLRRTGHGDPDGPWLPVGAGVNTGRVWFGTVGEGQYVAITVLGDVVNTTARLAAAAGPGEILVTVEAATAAGLKASLPRRSLELKGKAQPTEVVSLGVSEA